MKKIIRFLTVFMFIIITGFTSYDKIHVNAAWGDPDYFPCFNCEGQGFFYVCGVCGNRDLDPCSTHPGATYQDPMCPVCLADCYLYDSFFPEIEVYSRSTSNAISNNGVSYGDVIVYCYDSESGINSATYTLNGGESMTFNYYEQIFTEIGYYELSVTDKTFAGGHTTTYNFTIASLIQLNDGELEDGGMAYSNVKVTFYDNGYGIKSAEYWFDYEYMGTFVSGTVFSEKGEYYILVTYNNDHIVEAGFFIDYDIISPTILLNNGQLSSGAYASSNVTVTYFDNQSGIKSAEYSYGYDEYETLTSGTTFSEEGYYYILVEDNEGNIAEVDFTIDKTPPTIQVIENTSNHTFIVTYFDNITGIKSAEYYLDYEYMGAFTSGTIFSAEGEYYFIVEDNAGNIAEAEFTFFGDIIPPTILLNNGNLSDGACINGNVTVTYSDSDSGVKSAEYYLDYEYIGTFASGTIFSAEGDYYILVEDNAGNISERSFTIDKTAPFAYFNGSATFGAATSATITFTDPNYSHATYTFGGGTYTLTNGQVFTASGMYTIKIYDKAGNMISKAFRVS